MNCGTKRVQYGAKISKKKQDLLAEGEKCAKITDLFLKHCRRCCRPSANLGLDVNYADSGEPEQGDKKHDNEDD